MEKILKFRKSAVCMFNLALMALIALVTFSCSKNEDPVEVEPAYGEPSVLSLSIIPDSNPQITRATGSTHGVQADDNTVHTLEFFIFKNEGNDKGVLDTYEKLESVSSLSNIEINTTTGAKVIYAIANSHKTSWKGVGNIEQFKKELSGLKDENLKSFTMTGSAEVTLTAATPLSMTVSRLVARIGLTAIKTDFAGTPYEGSVLKNVKVYLLNASAEKLYESGNDGDTPVVYNSKKYVEADAQACAMSGMLYDAITTDIDDAGYTTAHYFYCYENLLSTETESNRFTRLVIQADLNGNTYYYPININREGYGYTASNGHAGVKRNTAYSVDVTICRPGSNNPDEILDKGVVTASVSVADWSVIPSVDVNF